MDTSNLYKNNKPLDFCKKLQRIKSREKKDTLCTLILSELGEATVDFKKKNIISTQTLCRYKNRSDRAAVNTTLRTMMMKIIMMKMKKMRMKIIMKMTKQKMMMKTVKLKILIMMKMMKIIMNVIKIMMLKILMMMKVMKIIMMKIKTILLMMMIKIRMLKLLMMMKMMKIMVKMMKIIMMMKRMMKNSLQTSPPLDFQNDPLYLPHQQGELKVPPRLQQEALQVRPVPQLVLMRKQLERLRLQERDRCSFAKEDGG